MSQTFSLPYGGGAAVNWSSHDDEEEGGYSERERKMLAYLENVTSAPQLEQVLHLQYILEKNANTEYLQKHGMNGATDVDSFRKCMPVTDYEAYRNSIERIANGDTSPILSADPAVEALVSSGTTGGDPKIYPVTKEDLGLRSLIWGFVAPTLSRAIPSLNKGKFLNLVFLRAGSHTPGGLPTKTAVTSFIQSEGYKKRQSHPIYELSSPAEVLETPDTNSAMYSHLLCGLLQRHEIGRIGAVYATVVVKALRALEKWWPEICHDIATGTLSKVRVQDETVRAAVLPLLLEKGAEWRAEQAESIRKECVSEDGLFKQDGILPRLWPKMEAIDTGGTGTMKAYLPALAHYSNNMRIVCTPLYCATEGFFGVNMNPGLPPEETYYVLLPAVAYYEFIAVGPPQSSHSSIHEETSVDNYYVKVHPTPDEEMYDVDATIASQDQVLGLTNLKVGQEYQILVTTISGYCRLSVGDVLKVVGSYNSSPLFQFMRRMNTLLSVAQDKTDEVELHAAVTKATQILERELPVLKILEYTSYTDLVVPGHYVIIWELASSISSLITEIPSSLLDRCCAALEASFYVIYRQCRYEDIIGPLELIIVQPGTFDLLCEHAVSLGASLNQYKVPRGLGPKQAALREIVKGRVLQRHFSSTKPPFNPSTDKTNSK